MQDPKSLTLSWRSYWRCGRARVSIRFDHWGGQYIENGLWRPDVNIIRSTVTYLNATINVKPATGNQRLELIGLAKPGETCGLTVPGPVLARQDSPDRDFGWVWNRTDLFFWSKPRLLAGYPDPLLTLFFSIQSLETSIIHKLVQLALQKLRHPE